MLLITNISHRMFFPHLLLIIICCIAPMVSKSEEQMNGNVYENAIAQSEDFISEMKINHNIDPHRLRLLIASSPINPKLLVQLSTPKETKISWKNYHALFISEKRIHLASKYCAKHISLLREVSSFYQVEPALICSILAIETYLGKITGSYKVFPTLANLAFIGKSRASFFKSELKHFILLSEAEKFDMFKIKGSYAGAMGHSQFISSSYRRLSIDFDCDGSRDLWNSKPDIFASVASYFNVSGWKYGGALLTELNPETVTGKIKLKTDRQLYKITATEIKNKKIKSLHHSSDFNPSQKGAIFYIEDIGGRRYWYGHNNFLTILKYNGATFYGAVVAEIFSHIQSRYQSYLANE